MYRDAERSPEYSVQSQRTPGAPLASIPIRIPDRMSDPSDSQPPGSHKTREHHIWRRLPSRLERTNSVPPRATAYVERTAFRRVPGREAAQSCMTEQVECTLSFRRRLRTEFQVRGVGV